MTKRKIDYTKLSDTDLLVIVNAKTGGIPMTAENEADKRKLFATYTGTFNSNMV